MENKGLIEELATKQNKNGESFFKLKIAGHNYSVFDQTTAYDQLKANEFKLGETVGFDYTETPGSFAGKPITYKNIVSFVKVAQPVAGLTQSGTITQSNTGTQPVDASVWEKKDQRIVRMASINAANELLRTNQLAMPDEAKMITEVSLFKLAGMIEAWVYRVDAQ